VTLFIGDFLQLSTGNLTETKCLPPIRMHLGSLLFEEEGALAVNDCNILECSWKNIFNMILIA
jgi:hypothetical protein